MRAVVYHADAHWAWGGKVGDEYRILFDQFRDHCHKNKMELIHLTVDGHPGWGDVNIWYPGLDPKNIMANREECFSQFIKDAAHDVYWFTEPDYRISRMWPDLEADCALLYRHGDSVPMCPAWRLATPEAAGLFKEFRDAIYKVEIRPGVGLDWHCDSAAFTATWERMGGPQGGIIEYAGIKIEFRDYSDYIKGRCTYGRNYLGKSKKELLNGGNI